ncbi:MAG: 1-acyl-sn-glycerol-3-phosphate acyltransferase [Anaerolineales bacterium]|nr:1-acyl-sn-glycerol-3-phosphate acyltransferase [Anaerolineales bacterium]MCB8962354.1 1-acyl-sn-glycerol-3-phosphate acyltransferase [Ardenticatenales bacterium]
MPGVSSLYQFTGNEYRTPAGKPRLLGDRLALGTRAYFVSQIAKIFWRGGRDVRDGHYNADVFTRVAQEIMSLVEGCGGRFHIQGFEQYRELSEPLIFASNHMSALENFVMPGLILPFKDTTFVVKASLLDYPVFGRFLTATDPIPLERDNPREDLQKVLQEGAARIERGLSLIIFPQSTRREDCDPESFNSLAVKLARKAGVRIVPVAVKTDFWGNGKLIRDFGPLRRDRPIHMRFGAPVTVTGNGREAHKEIVDYITSTFAGW